jgi:hypothetical protein
VFGKGIGHGDEVSSFDVAFEETQADIITSTCKVRHSIDSYSLFQLPASIDSLRARPEQVCCVNNPAVWHKRTLLASIPDFLLDKRVLPENDVCRLAAVIAVPKRNHPEPNHQVLVTG